MIQDAFNRIFNEYAKARKQKFANHPLADYIRNDIPQLFANALPAESGLNWDGSSGKGNWSEAPWIAAFDPIITDSAQRGYYPVYLFNSTLNTVYLSLNQGVTDLRKEFGVKPAKDILKHRANILRIRLAPDYRKKFSDKPIKLNPKGSSSLLAMYEAGHALGLSYRKNRVPPTEQILADLSSMLSLFRKVQALGGTTELDVGYQETDDESRTQDEIRRYRRHRSIDRNPGLAKAAKKIHGYTCQACGFEFKSVYGDLGHLYIEAHHLTPLSELPLNTPVPHSPRQDFAVVCGNCHRMIHRRKAPNTFAEFVDLVRRHRGNQNLILR
jgi:5-methylcytosine-specific restriction enzyme A